MLPAFPSNCTSPTAVSRLKDGHPDFEFYSVVVTPEHGLCKLTLAGNDVATSTFGTELKNKFEDLLSALNGKYGPPSNSFDFLRAGSIWNEPRDWMMGLLRKERTLASFWGGRNTTLPDFLQSISITASALSTTKAFIRISYEFDNIDACMQTLKTKRNSKL